MSRFSRLSDELRSRVDGLLSESTDLDAAHEQMREQLRDVEKGIGDVATERKRLERRVETLEGNVEEYNDRAREAVREGDEDAAREALEEKNRAIQRIDRLESEIEELEQAEEELLQRRDQLAERVRDFRTEKERLKARKRTAEAKADVAETTSGPGADQPERRASEAEESVRDAQARAAAMDELRERGVFDGPLSEDDEIERKLDEIETDETIDAELDTIRTEVREEEEAADGDQDGTGDGDA